MINLSLGTTNPAHAEKLADAVRYAAQRGALVVSARESNGVAVASRARSGVVGVVATRSSSATQLEVVRRRSRSAAVHRVALSAADPERARERNLSGVSFAVANVTGFLARATEASWR